MTTTLESSDRVARIIREQIGFWTITRVGGREFTFTADSLRLIITASNRRRIRVVVTLTPADTYTVFWGPASAGSRGGSAEGVYCDHLSKLIEDISAGTTEGWTR